MEKKLSNKAIKSWILGRTIGLIILVIIYLGIIFVLPKMDIQWADYILNNIVRIQNINLSEGPVNRKFNLADVKIGTAGGSYKIPNLDKEEVEKIREFLRIKINENVREELKA